MSGSEVGRRLVAAVRAGDVEAVRALLDEGADADAPGDDGLPVLCAAVAAFDSAVADVLVEGGADPDRVLPDGTTPLWRAVDGGSPAVLTAALGDEPRSRLPEATRERLLGLARSWYETGTVEELRRRTGASGPVRTIRLPDCPDGQEWIDQIALGGLVARTGHGGVLTALERAFGIPAPVDELIARALDQPGDQHANWWQAILVILDRPGLETWEAVVAHRHRPDPAHRRFVAEYLRTRGIVVYDSPYAEREGDFLAAWAAEETDVEMLVKVLEAFAEYEHPRLEVAGLRYAGHPDVRVRRQVPGLFWISEGTSPTPPARVALLGLTRDPDARVRLLASRMAVRDDALLAPAVQTLLALADGPDAELRRQAAALLASCPDHSPAVADALFALLDEDDPLTCLEAAYGLALRDDPRTAQAYRLVRDRDIGNADDHRWNRLWDWQYDKERSAAK
ncbi:ankyrin repeat domain-containing protein [Streptomyces caelestis]